MTLQADPLGGGAHGGRAGRSGADPVRDRGAGGSNRPLLVSPQHRMLCDDWRAQMLFGETEVLVAAKHLVNDRTIRRAPGAGELSPHPVRQSRDRSGRGRGVGEFPSQGRGPVGAGRRDAGRVVAAVPGTCHRIRGAADAMAAAALRGFEGRLLAWSRGSAGASRPRTPAGYFGHTEKGPRVITGAVALIARPGRHFGAFGGIAHWAPIPEDALHGVGVGGAAGGDLDGVGGFVAPSLEAVGGVAPGLACRGRRSASGQRPPVQGAEARNFRISRAPENMPDQKAARSAWLTVSSPRRTVRAPCGSEARSTRSPRP